MSYIADEKRYGKMIYSRVGKSGLKLPLISLGLWHNFGGAQNMDNMREMICGAFDLGITHFDLANNYGPPCGAAEENFGRILKRDLAPYRDELIISTKAGYYMWEGPYGEFGSKKHLTASLDKSLGRLGLSYVDIFYSHRYDEETPLEETMGAISLAVKQGKALYAGISNYPPEATKEAARLLRAAGTPCVIHQPSYSMFNRWVEDELLDVLSEEGMGAIAFSPLAQGLLTDKYIKNVPPHSRAGSGSVFLKPEDVTGEAVRKAAALSHIAAERGQTLAQMALSWVLRGGVTSALIGASSLGQIRENVGAIDNRDFTPAELSKIDEALK